MRPLTARVLLAALLAPAPVAAQLVRGRIVDAASGEGVAEATVSALTADQHGTRRVRSAADGSFVLELRAPGTYSLRGERTGYQTSNSSPIPVAARETLQVTLRMSVQATQIEPLTVTARQQPPHRRALELAGFYERESSGLGRFVRREDIERWGDHNLVHVLGRVPGVVLDVDRRGTEIVSFSRGRTVGTFSRTQSAQQNICWPAIFLDGLRITYDAPNPDLRNIVDGDQVEAVEAYRSAAEIPAQYNGSNSACGVIVIWTRREVDPPHP